MTSKRRHPAQASRILATGLSTATLLGIVAVLGAQSPAGPPDKSTDIAPARVTVVIGDPGANPPARRATARQAARRPDTSTRPS
jgi:hypothetical protein